MTKKKIHGPPKDLTVGIECTGDHTFPGIPKGLDSLVRKILVDSGCAIGHWRVTVHEHTPMASQKPKFIVLGVLGGEENGSCIAVNIRTGGRDTGRYCRMFPPDKNPRRATEQLRLHLGQWDGGDAKTLGRLTEETALMQESGKFPHAYSSLLDKIQILEGKLGDMEADAELAREELKKKYETDLLDIEINLEERQQAIRKELEEIREELSRLVG